MKTFTYTKQCGPSYYSHQTDEEFYEEKEFDYTVNNDEIKDAISDIIFENHFKNIISNIPELKENSDLRKNMFRNINKAIQNMINNCDLEDSLSEFYEDELKDYFEQDAMDSWGD